MRSRCRDSSNSSFRYYGARGITVCSEWGEYQAFKAWAESNGYRPGMSIDRIDPDGNYAPENCEWVTRGENTRRMLAHRAAFAHV